MVPVFRNTVDGIFVKTEERVVGTWKMAKTLLEVGADGVAILAINNPPLNLLSADVLPSLKENCEEALRRDDVKAIVITGSNGKFSGGFDVTAFGRKGKSRKLGFWSIDFLTDTLEAARKPFVAAIDGPALGGGFEIALACHARIATSSSLLGLPELRYGILPGFGGTQRLPRLIGLSKALDMILMSKLVKGEDAYNLGIVDSISSADELLTTASHWALDILERRRPWSACLYRNNKLEPLAEARVILGSAKIRARSQEPNLKHPLVCIDVIEEGVVSGPRAGLSKESEALEVLRQSEACKSLVYFFFAQSATSKIPGITDQGLKPRKLSQVAVIGGGVLGAGLVTALLICNYLVILKEMNQKLLLAGTGRVKDNLQELFRQGEFTEKELGKKLTILKGVLDYESLGDVDLVIEAAEEDIQQKQKIFTELERCCSQQSIFVSITSITRSNYIAEIMKSFNRIVGVHFFSSPHIVPLMEIVQSEKTSPQAIVDMLSLAKKMKKTAVVVRSTAGLLTNWMFIPYSEAASTLVEHGVDIEQINNALAEFGMKTCPIRMVDSVGVRVVNKMEVQLTENFSGTSYQSNLKSVMQGADRAGNITQKAHNIYHNGHVNLSPDAEKYIDKAMSSSQEKIDSKALKKFSNGEIVEMVLFPVVNKACRLLEDGTVVKASDLDVAAVLGMGFPAYRGGIIFWANSLGSEHLYSKLDEWTTTYGALYQPCNYIAERGSKRLPLVSFMKAKSQL